MAEQQAWINGELYYKNIKEMFVFISQMDNLKEYTKWKIDFINIHGFLDTQRRLDIKKLEIEYGVILSTDDELFKFLFCLETYYSIILRIFGD
jgi:hypothetical protein